MSFGFPTAIQQAKNKMNQAFQMVQSGTGQASSGPTDGDAVVLSAVIESPPPGIMGGTTKTLVETASGDVFEHSQSATLDGDKWVSFGKAPSIDY